MLVNPFKPERSASPRLLSCGSNDQASKKTSHSPWTASKPRKKNRQLDDGSSYEDNYSNIGLHSDENLAPSCSATAGASLDVNMLASGFEKLRVFRKACGVKGARQSAAARLPEGLPNTCTGAADIGNNYPSAFQQEARSGATAQGDAVSNQQPIGLTASFLSGVQALRTASEPACRPPELHFTLMGGFAGSMGTLSVVARPAGDKQETPCFTPGAQNDVQTSSCCFQQPFGVPAAFGASCKVAPREPLRAVDLTALSADCILMGPPPPRQPTAQQTSRGPTQAPNQPALCSSQSQGAALQGMEAHPNPAHALHGSNMEHLHGASDHALHGDMEEHAEEEGQHGGPHRGRGEVEEEEDDRRPFLLPPLCLDGEDDSDVWDEEFRIVTRPLGWIGEGPRGGPQPAPRPSASGGGGGHRSQVFTPTTASCTPRVLVTGFIVTPASSARMYTGGGNGTTPRRGGTAAAGSGAAAAAFCPDSSGRPLVHYYGRAGYCSTATSTGGCGNNATGGGGTPGPQVKARRAPTPAGRLLGRTFEDEDDDDEEEEGMCVQGVEGTAGPDVTLGAAGRAAHAQEPASGGGAGGAAGGRGSALLKAVAKALGRFGGPSGGAAGGQAAQRSPFSIFSPGSHARGTGAFARLSGRACSGGGCGNDQPTPDGDNDHQPSRGRLAGAAAKHYLGALGRRIGRRDTLDTVDDLEVDGGCGAEEEEEEEEQETGTDHVGHVSVEQLDPEVRRLEEERALANLMCDENDFYTPIHSPRAPGLPAWHLGSEARPSDLRRTHSADEAMMSRDLNGHTGSHAVHHHHHGGKPAANAHHHNQQHGFNSFHAASNSFHAASMLHPAASLDAGMELAFGMACHGGRQGGGCMDGSCGQPMCAHHHAAHMGHMHGSHDAGQHRGTCSLSDWAMPGGMHGGMHGGSCGGGGGHIAMHHQGSLMGMGGGSQGRGHMEDDSHMMHMLPVNSLDTLEEFNTQLSLAAERGDRGRAERLWGELRGRSCILPDMRTLNMLMRCLCKSLTHPDEAEMMMCDVCTLGDIKPNATTLTLLAEMRLRYEHTQGYGY